MQIWGLLNFNGADIMVKKYSDRLLNGLAKALHEHCSTRRSGFQNYLVGQSTNQQAINVRSGFQKKPISPIVKALLETLKKSSTKHL
jgi:hypothetical protein